MANVKGKKRKVEEKEIERKIPPKNYLILAVIFIVTIVVVFGLRSWYISYENYQLTIPVLKNKINEVTPAELENYLTENINAIIYIEVTDDENSRDVASDLYDVLSTRDLVSRSVYISLDEDEINSFLSEFNNKYMENGEITNYPALVVFDEGNVLTYTFRSNSQRLNIGDIEQIFDEYELEGE